MMSDRFTDPSLLDDAGPRAFLDSHAHVLLGTFIGEDNAPAKITAVVSCAEGGPQYSLSRVSRLAAELRSKGIYSTTKHRLCDSPVLGIIAIAEWPANGVQLLREAIQTVMAEDRDAVTFVHVYNMDTHATLAAVSAKDAIGGLTLTHYGVISFGDSTYYKDPDDRMNTSAPLVLARRYTVHELSEAQEQARLVEGVLEIWEFQGDTPVKRIDSVPGEHLTGKYGNKDVPAGVRPMNLFG